MAKKHRDVSKLAAECRRIAAESGLYAAYLFAQQHKLGNTALRLAAEIRERFEEAESAFAAYLGEVAAAIAVAEAEAAAIRAEVARIERQQRAQQRNFQRYRARRICGREVGVLNDNEVNQRRKAVFNAMQQVAA